MLFSGGIHSQEDHRDGSGKINDSSHRDILRWFLCIPIVLQLIMFCGQSALWGQHKSFSVDTLSLLKADYSEWERFSIGFMKKQFVSGIRSDLIFMSYPGTTLLEPLEGAALFLNPKIEQQPEIEKGFSDAMISPTAAFVSVPFPTGTNILDEEDVLSTGTGTSTPTFMVTPSRKYSPTPMRTATNSSVPSATRTASVKSHAPVSTATPTSTRDAPLPTNTPTPLFTSTATRTAEAAATSTPVPTNTSTPAPTSTSSAVSTYTETPTATSTAVPTDTPTATATEVVVTGNVFWFSDQVNLAGDHMMYPSSQAGGLSQNMGGVVPFETESFASGTTLQAGTTTVHVYAVNVFPQARNITATIYTGWGSLGSGQAEVPGLITDPVLITFNFPTSSAVFHGDGRFLMADFGLDAGVRIYWSGSAYEESRIEFPGMPPP